MGCEVSNVHELLTGAGHHDATYESTRQDQQGFMVYELPAGLPLNYHLVELSAAYAHFLPFVFLLR